MILMIAAIVVAGCSSGTPLGGERVVEEMVAVTAVVEQEAAPEAAPQPQPTPEPYSAGDTGGAPLPVAYRVNRMIIKNAEMRLQVIDTDAAIDLLIWIVVVLGPFILLLVLIVWLGIRLRRRWRKMSE